MKDYVGFSLRLPPELHRQIKALAKQDVRSLNGELVYAVREFVEKRSKKEQDDG